MSDIKIAAGMITFNSDYVLNEVLTSLYKHVDQILIAEGPIEWWHKKLGVCASNDETNKILRNLPDQDYKIKVVHNIWKEKEEQCNGYMDFLMDDIDYVINVDSDELYLDSDWEKIKEILSTKKYTEIQFRSNTFYGGFDHLMGGFESNVKYVRIQKVYPSARWATHRPPRIEKKSGINDPPNILTHEDTEAIGIKMFHYSYVFPRQVKEKLDYYYHSLNPNNCIPYYFENVYLPWVLGNKKEKERVEEKYNGVHEFINRKPTFTKPFEGEHPKVIQDNLERLKEKFNKQLKEYL